MKIFKTLLFCTISLFSNAQNWYSVGGGIDAGYAELFAFEDKLFAGGAFSTMDGIPARGLAYWDDKKWKSYFLDSLLINQTGSFVIYQNELFAYSNNSSSFNGAGLITYDKTSNTWSNMPNSQLTYERPGIEQDIRGWVSHAIEFQNELYVAGRFDHIGDVPIKNVARWNGIEWRPVTTGLGFGMSIESINALEIYNDELMMLGALEVTDNVFFNGIAIWDGDFWSNIEGELISNISNSTSLNIYDLEVFNGELYAAGSNIWILEELKSYPLVKWDGNNWKGIDAFDSNQVELSTLKKFSHFLALGGNKIVNGNVSSVGLTYLYNGKTRKKIEGDFSNSIRNFAVFNHQLFVGTYISSNTISNNIGVFRLGKINTDEDSNLSCDFFPNPSQGEFMINYEALENTSTIISFYNISGILVHEEIFNDLKGPYLRRFNLQDLHTGVYIVQIQSKGINESKMIMKN